MKTEVEDHLVQVSTWPWLFTTSTLVCALSSVYLWWRHSRYGCNKGPKLLPIVGCLPKVLMNINRLYDWSTEEMKRTPTMTLRGVLPGLDYIETANAANVEHVLKTKFENYPKGGFIGSVLTDLLGLGIFNVDGTLWKLQRRVASPVFSTRSLRELALRSVQKELADRLVPMLEHLCDSIAVVDLQELLFRFTFDTICQVAFGTDPGCLNSELSSVSFAEAFDDAVSISSRRILGIPPPWQVLKLFNIGSERKLRQSLLVVDAFALDLIETRRQELAEGQCQQASDLLSKLVQIADEFVQSPEIKQRIEEDPRSKYLQASDLFLRDIVFSLILAGRDTSASGLTWFFWLLARNPKVQATICTEIEAISASRRDQLSKDSASEATRMNEDATYSFENLKDMHYLHAALTESMRLYPPVPQTSKEAAADDVFPDGTVIAKGKVISLHVYAMGRNERIWGSDCLEFRPERFLQDGLFVAPSPFAYPVFLAGPRICLGMDMAMMQMKLVAASLLRRYVFVVPEGHSARYQWAVTMKIMGGLPVHVRRRESHRN